MSSSVSSRVILVSKLDSIKLYEQVLQVVPQISETGHDPFCCCIQVLSRLQCPLLYMVYPLCEDLVHLLLALLNLLHAGYKHLDLNVNID